MWTTPPALPANSGGRFRTNFALHFARRHAKIAAMDYEFRFFRGGAFLALHRTVVETDSDAVERARTYLSIGPQFQYVEVRRGLQFMRRVQQPGRSQVPLWQ